MLIFEIRKTNSFLLDLTIFDIRNEFFLYEALLDLLILDSQDNLKCEGKSKTCEAKKHTREEGKRRKWDGKTCKLRAQVAQTAQTMRTGPKSCEPGPIKLGSEVEIVRTGPVSYEPRCTKPGDDVNFTRTSSQKVEDKQPSSEAGP